MKLQMFLSNLEYSEPEIKRQIIAIYATSNVTLFMTASNLKYMYYGRKNSPYTNKIYSKYNLILSQCWCFILVNGMFTANMQ